MRGIEAVEWGKRTIVFERSWLLFIAGDWRLEFSLPDFTTPDERKVVKEMIKALSEGEPHTPELAVRIFRMIEKYLIQKRRREEGYEV